MKLTLDFALLCRVVSPQEEVRLKAEGAEYAVFV
jgi:hypothetical protein